MIQEPLYTACPELDSGRPAWFSLSTSTWLSTGTSAALSPGLPKGTVVLQQAQQSCERRSLSLIEVRTPFLSRGGAAYSTGKRFYFKIKSISCRPMIAMISEILPFMR